MKRIALILTLIGLMFAACSTAPVAEPDPVPGVIDLTMFPEDITELYLTYLCYADGFAVEVDVEIANPGKELDLDAYRPVCDGSLASHYEFDWYPEELLDAGFAHISGPSIESIEFNSESNRFWIWPKGLGEPYVWVMFYANEGGHISLDGSFPGLISALEEEDMLTIRIDASYSPGWNLLYEVEEINDGDYVLEINIVPLNSVEWNISSLMNGI